MSTSRPVVGSPACGAPPMPRSDMPPAAPSDTPNPITPRAVMNSPGTCSVSDGSSDACLLRSICSRPTTDTVIGRWRMSDA